MNKEDTVTFWTLDPGLRIFRSILQHCKVGHLHFVQETSHSHSADVATEYSATSILRIT